MKKATGIMLGVASGVATGLVLDHIREERKAAAAKKLADARKDAPIVAGRLADWLTEGTFPAGYYVATVEAPTYNVQGTPLDDAIKSKKVELVRAVVYGARASNVWLLIRVPSTWKGEAAWKLDGWANWKKTTADAKPEDTISESDRTGGVMEDIFDGVDKAARYGVQLVERAKSGASLLAWGIAGAVVLGFFFRSRDAGERWRR